LGGQAVTVNTNVETVLLVGADGPWREKVKLALQEGGRTVVDAVDVAEAVKRLAVARFSAVVAVEDEGHNEHTQLLDCLIPLRADDGNISILMVRAPDSSIPKNPGLLKAVAIDAIEIPSNGIILCERLKHALAGNCDESLVLASDTVDLGRS